MPGMARYPALLIALIFTLGAAPGPLHLNPGHYYFIKNAYSGKVVEIVGGECARGNGLAVDQYAKNGGDNQLFALKYDAANDAFALEARQSDDVIDLPADQTGDDGTALQQRTADGAKNQLWRITKNPDGTVRISSAASGKVFDVRGGEDAEARQDGALLQQYAWNGGANQRFSLIDSGVAVGPAPPRHCKLEELVGGTYRGNVQLLYDGVPVYNCAGCRNFLSTDTSTASAKDPVYLSWIAEPGTYSGGVTGTWIRWNWVANADNKPRPYVVWQSKAVNKPVTAWNDDGAANGPPEDTELFYFEAADAGNNVVRIKTRYNGYLYAADGTFASGATAASAALFTAVFP